jgi:hypothetical protein
MITIAKYTRNSYVILAFKSERAPLNFYRYQCLTRIKVGKMKNNKNKLKLKSNNTISVHSIILTLVGRIPVGCRYPQIKQNED